MKLSKTSIELLSFFAKNKNVNHGKITKQTEQILLEIYGDIMASYKHLLASVKNGAYFKRTVKKLSTPAHISYPKNFSALSFPESVRNYINELSGTELTYTFSLHGRSVTIHFIVEERVDELDISAYDKYVDTIVMWLYILNKHASKKCSHKLTLYFYFTSLEKKLPLSNEHIIDEINVNTAFTTTCPKDSEIVVFRREEWLKVFIHETFHNFGLDFSDINYIDNCILEVFKVNADVRAYESYTEFWAEILNALFCSFFSLKNIDDKDEFLTYSKLFINFERSYSFFQLEKALDFMGLDYIDLYKNTSDSKSLRERLYKEKTSVLSYYVLKTVLMNNYQGFLSWCKTYNFSLFQFSKTMDSQREFCRFIVDNYKSKSMLSGVAESRKFLNKLKKRRINVSDYVLSNFRMSICELG